jgi:hypothetical protein
MTAAQLETNGLHAVDPGNHMKRLASVLILASSLAGSPAFAINPCHSIIVKKLVCEIVDSAHSTRANVQISREVTSGGEKPYCTTGVVYETIDARPFFNAEAGERSDLLFGSTNLVKPLETLEKGQRVEANLYTVGLNLQDIDANLTFIPQGGVIQASLSLQARIIRIYSAEQAPVMISGSANCTEQR